MVQSSSSGCDNEPSLNRRLVAILFQQGMIIILLFFINTSQRHRLRGPRSG